MRRIAWIGLPALLLWPMLALAQQSAPAPLPDWDGLTPAQRDALIAPLRDRWNNSPDDRTRMLERARRWSTMSPDQHRHARRGMERWDDMSPEQRNQARAVFYATRGMDRDARRAFMDNWRKKTPQQQEEWVKAHPAPADPRPGR